MPLPRLLDLPPHDLAAEITRRASERAGCAVGVYVVDIEGRCLKPVLDTGGRLPESIEVIHGIGPELPAREVGELRRRLREQGAGLEVVPLWLHGRAIGALVSERTPAHALEPLADEAGAAIELAGGLTDAFERARRRRGTSPAAETQESLLPPRIAFVPGAELAAAILPAYDVGGDWFDHASDEDGTWLALGDAVGKGAGAAALSAVTVGALRSARRAGEATLAAAAGAIDEAVRAAGPELSFMTAVLARWEPARERLSWLRFGHPYPLLVSPSGEVRELHGGDARPLGLLHAPIPEPACVRLVAGDRLVLYSDGISERRCRDGKPFGVAGIAAALADAVGPSATAAAVALQAAVMEHTGDPLRDDASLLVLAPTG